MGFPFSAATASAASCTDVDVTFARGTLELPGLGIVGGPFTQALIAELPGKSVTTYAVDYLADPAQLSAGSGATKMTEHVISVAARCPNTRFVIGGYSQGATVTDIAAGIKTVLGSGTAIPASLASRVVAVVTFGNPIRLTGKTIAAGSPTYSPKWADYCASGDPVCNNGVSALDHVAYIVDGSTEAGAKFAAARVLSATS
ncbi:cutinase family protein [Nocardia sp. bgisy134]|uniref:cutinase family protein n=1 Tax=Nocardia sp. bgisy134 TaxID=3413789 RepID=UPI003D7352CC